MAFGTLVNTVLLICLILFFFCLGKTSIKRTYTVGIDSFCVAGYNVGDCISSRQDLSSLHVLFQLGKMNSNKAAGVDGLGDG